jgi:hypothetical protein
MGRLKWYLNGIMGSIKRETIEEYAKREADEDRIRAENRKIYLENQQTLVKETPKRFFELANEVKQAVLRFNKNAAQEKVLSWHESPACVARDTNPDADFSISFWRTGPMASEVEVRVVSMTRAKGPDCYLIQATGKFKEERFLIRVEGMMDRARKLSFRMTCDSKLLPFEIDLLAERLVLAAVKCDLSLLLEA